MEIRLAVLGNTINDLTDIKARIELLRTYRDWVRKFFKNLIIRLGGKNEWYDVKKSIPDYYDYNMNISNRKCINELNNILNGINMNIDDLELLLEIKGESNDAFYKNWQKIEKAKEGLTKKFPDNMEKYKNLLQKLFDASGT
ncbi:hypothetical protein RclHR1_16140003 [Rhizophagus clarus]|nr:hypothetical protein RclHR1_16140003 [Rhizophagus clarus]